MKRRRSKYAELPPPTGIAPATEETKEAVAEQTTLRPRSSLKFYPIHADTSFPFSRMQVDLVDLVDIDPSKGRNNHGYRYIYLAIDLYSRYLIAVPMKFKSSPACTSALEQTLALNGQTPNTIQSDKESGFVNPPYTTVADENHVNLDYRVDATDHRFLAFIDRAVRTLRQILQVYTNTYDTENWVDVLPQLIATYNATVHSGTHASPDELVHIGPKTKAATDYAPAQVRKKIRIANQQPYNQVVYKVGDEVRYQLELAKFQKRTHPQFSRTVHRIREIVGNSYFYITGRDRPYRKDQLLLVHARHQPTVQVQPLVERQAAQRRVNRNERDLNSQGVSRQQSISDEAFPPARATRSHTTAAASLLR